MATGRGRGGRGQSLMDLLKKAKPGVQETESSARTDEPQRPSSTVKPPPSLGSFSDMKKMAEEVAAAGGDAKPVPLIGRGRAMALSLAAARQTSSFGRGLASGTSMPQPKPDVQINREAIVERTQPQVEEPPSGNNNNNERHSRPERQRKPTVSMIGEDGNKADLSANYVRVKCRNKEVLQYHVHYDPVIDNKNLRIRLLHEHREFIKTKAFDGSILYLPRRLEQDVTQLVSTRRSDGAKVILTIKFIKTVPPEQCSQLYNVLFRRIMNILKMAPVGRYYYNPNTPATVPQHKLEVWPGYITAIHEQEGGLLLMLDVSHKVLRTETVLDVCEDIVRRNSASFKEEIIKKVVGNVVLTRYNNKTYRIDDIVFDKTPMSTFPYGSSGEEMTFVDYYKSQYNITIQNLTQPLLLHKEKPPKGDSQRKPKIEFVCLVPELCFMCGLTDEIRKQFTIMKDLAVHTRVTPAQRQLAMKKFISSVNQTPEAKAELDSWGLQLDTSNIAIAGRQFNPEKVIFGNDKFVSAGNQADWGRDATRSRLITPIDLNNWGVFFTRRDNSKANEFIRSMQAETRNMGIVCKPPFRVELQNEKIETLVQMLRSKITPEVQIVVVINPTRREDKYSAIKKTCCVEYPVPSQVINANTIAKPDKLRSVVQKIALQINCKLGGELWAVKMPLDRLMVVGIDSYHDNTRGKQSIGGFVSSLNRNCTRWFSNVCFQKPGQELVEGFQLCLTAALRKYYDENHFLPEKICIFRDGVGDGQLDVLADHEVKQLYRSFLTFGEQYKPATVTVVVQKRINTRIYERERDGSLTNPKPGTVVDHTVTRRDRYDYFIVSQHVRQGTVSPTHYIVVDDSLKLTPDRMQKLTYKMTHLYYNWPGTVRVPAPCQYAHKLAYLVGESVHKAPDESLSDRLFFL